jgi:hypothetical protein
MSLELANPNEIVNVVLEEEALLARLRAGDETAFEKLVREQTRRLASASDGETISGLA